MDLLKSLLFAVILNNVLTEPLHSDEHEDAFHIILNFVKSNDTLRLEDVNSILTMLQIHDCSNATQHKCVTAESLFKISNVSTQSTVGENEFLEFAPIIVYALLPNEPHSDEHNVEDGHDDDHDHDHNDNHNHGGDHNHDDDGDHDEDHDDEKQITQNVNVYEEFLKRYETGVLCEQIFDQLLTDVNRTTGQLLEAGSKCFSSDDILHELNISSDVGKSLLPEISMIIISKLLQKQCIKVRYQTPLPCSSHFVNELFSEYAENDFISEEKMKELLEKLKIGAKNATTIESTHDHDHRRRRSLTVPSNLLQSQIQGKPFGLQRRYRRETNDHNHNHDNEPKKYQKCYSLGEFFAIYHVEKKKGFTLGEFQRLSSALLQQIESDACKEESHDEHSSDSVVATKHKWGYGILAVAIISLCSVAGLAIIPFMHSIFYQKTVMFFISLAVGTLVGDALLHLFPHALGFHANHDHGHSSESSHESEDRDYLWKFLLATAAIYGFFLFETFTHLFLRKSIGRSNCVEHTRGHSQFADHKHEHQHDMAELSAVESGCQTTNASVILGNKGYLNSDALEECKNSDHGATSATKNEKDWSDECYPENSSQVKEKSEVKKTISSVAWNIIIGDTIHNVADGIAIGVAFSDSIFGGVSTTIAVFCHELPHELGDFAVLLSAGMSVRKALLVNFLSACSCFLGLVFGILISEIEDVNLWIFAATGGFFIYIALTNMLPELMHSDGFSGLSKSSRFFLQNAGILTGFAIMFLLSYFEEDINI